MTTIYNNHECDSRSWGNGTRWDAKVHYRKYFIIVRSTNHWSACITKWQSGLPDGLISTYIAQFMGFVIGRIHYGLKFVLCFRHITAFHYHHCARQHRHWIHTNVCRVSCGGVFNMLLVLSIPFYFHYNIWGCICSTGPFQYRWLKGYIYSSCYYHQIGSIHLSHCYDIFPWLCAWDACCIIFCHLLHIRSGICFHNYCAVYDECK